MNINDILSRPRVGTMVVSFYEKKPEDGMGGSYPLIPVGAADRIRDIGMAIAGFRALVSLIAELHHLSEGSVLGLIARDTVDNSIKAATSVEFKSL